MVPQNFKNFFMQVLKVIDTIQIYHYFIGNKHFALPDITNIL
jgi:hypothetical protein